MLLDRSKCPDRGHDTSETWQTRKSPAQYGRQLVALNTLFELLAGLPERIECDADLSNSEPRRPGRNSSIADYAKSILLYLAFAIDKVAEGSTTICTWSPLPTKLHVVNTFGRQALPMTWGFAEANIFANSSGNILRMSELIAEVIEQQHRTQMASGHALVADAAHLSVSIPRIISTDPPYFDNIGYSDLADFFYVWLRRYFKGFAPDLFDTVTSPKEEELVATPYRHGGKHEAEAFFLRGMTTAMQQLSKSGHPAFPVTIFYAFKQSENETEEGSASTGWETFLAAVIRAGFSISGTWPMRTERSGGFRNKDQNALASSIVLVCRPRQVVAPIATRREFMSALRAEIPLALSHLQHSNIAPVDLAQAAIGPGMAIYTRYLKVVDSDGNPLPVRDALGLINQTLDEVLAEQEGDFDSDIRATAHSREES